MKIIKKLEIQGPYSFFSLPKVARIPHAAQMIKQGPTAATLASTDLGEMKIPEPIIVPTIIQIPLIRPTLK